MCHHNIFGQHNFSHGTLTEEERKEKYVGVVVCLNAPCDLRVAMGGPISKADMVRARLVADAFIKGTIKPYKILTRRKSN